MQANEQRNKQRPNDANAKKIVDKGKHSDNKRTTRSKKNSTPQKQHENGTRFPHDIEILHLLSMETTR